MIYVRGFHEVHPHNFRDFRPPFPIVQIQYDLSAKLADFWTPSPLGADVLYEWSLRWRRNRWGVMLPELETVRTVRTFELAAPGTGETSRQTDVTSFVILPSPCVLLPISYQLDDVKWMRKCNASRTISGRTLLGLKRMRPRHFAQIFLVQFSIS